MRGLVSCDLAIILRRVARASPFVRDLGDYGVCIRLGLGQRRPERRAGKADRRDEDDCFHETPLEVQG